MSEQETGLIPWCPECRTWWMNPIDDLVWCPVCPDAVVERW